MNLETAKLVCDLVELKNFSRAADLHGISQSAVSQQIAQIEMDHRIQLFDRKKRPVELTAAGQLFYRACKDILERYNLLTSELSQLSQSHSSIRLAAIFSIGMHTLQPYVKKFMSIYPDVNLSVEYNDAKDIYDKLLRGQLDIGVVAMPRRDRNLQVYGFENEPLMLVCSPDHPLAAQPEIDIHQLQGEKFIAFAQDVPTRELINSIMARYGVNVRIVMEFDNIETIKRAVEINSGVSILPKSSLRMEMTSGSLKAILLNNENFYRPTGIIVRRDRTLSKAARYLIELMRKDFEADV
jgi:LysR family transcriptional regulator, transcriptional activator of the cysJI operon